MDVAKLFISDGSQAVILPKEFWFEGSEVSIRRDGEAVVLEARTNSKPRAKRAWPDGFFENIRITDPDFERPNQGVTPLIKG